MSCWRQQAQHAQKWHRCKRNWIIRKLIHHYTNKFVTYKHFMCLFLVTNQFFFLFLPKTFFFHPFYSFRSLCLAGLKLEGTEKKFINVVRRFKGHITLYDALWPNCWHTYGEACWGEYNWWARAKGKKLNYEIMYTFLRMIRPQFVFILVFLTRITKILITESLKDLLEGTWRKSFNFNKSLMNALISLKSSRSKRNSF